MLFILWCNYHDSYGLFSTSYVQDLQTQCWPSLIFFWLTILRSGNLKDLRSFWSLKPLLDLRMKWRSAWGLSTQKVNPIGYHLSCIVECCGWRIWFTYIAVSFYQSHTLHFSIACFPVSCRTLTTSTHFLVETPGVRKRNISGTTMNNKITYLLSKNVISKGDVNKKRHIKSITLRIIRSQNGWGMEIPDPCEKHIQCLGQINQWFGLALWHPTGQDSPCRRSTGTETFEGEFTGMCLEGCSWFGRLVISKLACFSRFPWGGSDIRHSTSFSI